MPQPHQYCILPSHRRYLPFEDAYSNYLELAFVGILTMLALSSSVVTQPDGHTSNEVERDQHAAFLLVWQILGIVVPVVVLFNLSKRAFRLLRARWNKKKSVSEENVAPKHPKHPKKTNRVGHWILRITGYSKRCPETEYQFLW